MMKVFKHTALVLAAFLLLSCFAACEKAPEAPTAAQLMNDHIATVDAQTASVLASATDVTCSGTVYYVAADGDDTADGLTPETAWKSVARVNEAELQSGDGVFFRRGDKFRITEQLTTKNGVTYSAYGEGDKPMLLCSVDAGDWTAWEGTQWPNVYKCTLEFAEGSDIGGIIFNDGEAWGIKVLTKRNGESAGLGHVFNGIEHYDYETGSFPRYSGLDGNLEFFYDRELGDLYLYCAYGLPDEYFESIELCDTGHGIGGQGENVVIDNIAVYGSGSFAIGYDYRDNNGKMSADPIDVKIQNCAFYYTGGGIYVQYDEPYHMDYPILYDEVVASFNLAGDKAEVYNCYALLYERECEADCTGKDDAGVTLIGRKHYFDSKGIVAEKMAQAKLDTGNYQLQDDSIGYIKGHTKVLVTAVKE